MTRIEKIPTNVFTGLLGVGKTTALLDVLARKPGTERWAVLVNEFGEIPIDQAAFEGREDTGIFVKEVAGGCLCCTAGVPLQVAVVMLLRQTRPQRLLIEMSGLGHPGFVIRSLREGKLADAVDLRAAICLVDPRDVEEPEILRSQTFMDQVHVADVLVANKSDLCTPEALEEFNTWTAGLFPPKRVVATTTHGRLDLDWLDIDTDPLRAPLFEPPHPDEHAHGHDHDAHEVELAPGRPYRAESSGLGHAGCGWIFSPEERFDRDRLLDCLAESDDVRRIKGVFRVGGEWLLVNRTGAEITASPTAYCRDSRLEVISEKPLDWLAWERDLLACVRPVPVSEDA